MIVTYNMLINGESTQGSSSDWIEVENPANEQIIAKVPRGKAEDGLLALDAAAQAQKHWSKRPAINRAELVRKLADALIARKSFFAQLLTGEQGKPLNQAEGEVEGAANFLRYAAEQARRMEGDIMPSDNPDEQIWINVVPRGVVVGLTAWNYPLALAARKVGPALVAGNSFVLLAHEGTPLSGIEFAKLALEIGIPAGVFNVVTGVGPEIGQAMVESPLSDLITMTGSTRAGKTIYRTGADTLKTVRLELGGKAPFIVMEDADIDKAVEAAVVARYTNCGQICTCNERMILHKDISEKFLAKFIERSKALSIGDPLKNPDIGPKVSKVEVEKMDAMVASSISQGAEVLLKGGRLNTGEYAKGHWYAPTIIEPHSADNILNKEEVFGPVVSVQRVNNYDEAIHVANDSDYGLSAYMFTQNISRLMEMRQRLNFGEIYFNRANGEQVQGFHNGWKLSGLGGEDGKYGFDSYIRRQTTYVRWR